MLDNELTYKKLELFLSDLLSGSDASSLSVVCEVGACLHELNVFGLDDSFPDTLRFPASRLWRLFHRAETAFNRSSGFVDRCDFLYGMYQLLHGVADASVPVPGEGDVLCEDGFFACEDYLCGLLDEYPPYDGGALSAAALDRVLVVAQAPYGFTDSRAGHLLTSHLRSYARSQRVDGSWCIDAVADGDAVALRRLEVLRLTAFLLGDLSYERVFSSGLLFYGDGFQDVLAHRALRLARALSSEVFSRAETMVAV